MPEGGGNALARIEPVDLFELQRNIDPTGTDLVPTAEGVFAQHIGNQSPSGSDTAEVVPQLEIHRVVESLVNRRFASQERTPIEAARLWDGIAAGHNGQFLLCGLFYPVARRF